MMRRGLFQACGTAGFAQLPAGPSEGTEFSAIGRCTGFAAGNPVSSCPLQGLFGSSINKEC